MSLPLMLLFFEADELTSECDHCWVLCFFFQKKVCLLLLCAAVFTAAMGTGIIKGIHSRKKRSLALGIICDVFNVNMYFSPLTIMVSFSSLPLCGHITMDINSLRS